MLQYPHTNKSSKSTTKGGEKHMKFHKVLLTLVAVSLLATPTFALAQFAQFSDGFKGTASGDDLLGSITDIVNVLLTLAAVIAVIFVIIGGVRYITSQGDEDASLLAKNTIIFAIIGVIVIALSAVIVNFLLGAVNPT
jgi:type IV secretory pathway VirB2 component (pilin)